MICDEVTWALDPLVANGIPKLLLNLRQIEQVAYLFILTRFRNGEVDRRFHRRHESR